MIDVEQKYYHKVIKFSITCDKKYVFTIQPTNQTIIDIIILKDLQDEIEKHREMYMSLNNTGEK